MVADGLSSTDHDRLVFPAVDAGVFQVRMGGPASRDAALAAALPHGAGAAPSASSRVLCADRVWISLDRLDGSALGKAVAAEFTLSAGSLRHVAEACRLGTVGRERREEA